MNISRAQKGWEKRMRKTFCAIALSTMLFALCLPVEAQ